MSTLHALAAADESTKWILIALGIITVAYIVLRPMVKGKKDPLMKGPNFSLSQQRAVEREMQNLLVELSQMARQITAQLDTRSEKLNLLIQEADAKIAELRRLEGETGITAAKPPETRPSDAEPPKTAAFKSGDDARYADIYALADDGQSAQEIAQQLGRPRGEVELILALRAR